MKEKSEIPDRPKNRQQQLEKQHADELLDEALDETFPASDPPAMLEPARKEKPKRSRH